MTDTTRKLGAGSREVDLPRRRWNEAQKRRIVIKEIRDGEADVDYPVFVAGERRCPPEDVGGVPGFMRQRAYSGSAGMAPARSPSDSRHRMGRLCGSSSLIR